MAQPVLNPVDLRLLLPLLPAEREFARCLAEGDLCTVGNGELPEEEIESGENANVVRGEVIHFFAYGGDSYEHPIRTSVIFLQGAWIPKEPSLFLTHANISRALLFHNCHFACSVEMSRAECVALYLDGSRFAQGFNASGLTTKGGVHLRNGFSAEGEVRLLGANVGGNLSCGGGKFHNPKGKALSADGLTTKGGVNLRDGFSAEGEVRLLSANVGGDLSCEGGKFHNLEGKALNADGITTKGSVNLRGGFSAEGEVRLLGANIGGGLDCTGGKFHNPNGGALTADSMTTKGGVNLCEGFSAEGEVRMPAANIGGRLSCEDGRFYNLEGCALDVEGAIINGGFIWREISGGGSVALVYAKIGVFADDADSWKPFEVVLDGFTYNSFAGPVDGQSRLDWLEKRPRGMRFSPLPYEQAAKVLFGMGHAKEAREILLEKERLQTADKRTPLLRKIGRRLWDVFAGYGYRLRYTLGWMAFFVYTGTCVFLDADLQHRIVPHQSVVLADQKYQDAIADGAKPTEFVPEMFSGYPEFNQFWLSVDIFIPLFNLHQETHWIPARDERGGFPWITLWYWIEIAAGWILTSLLLLSITGLLRPRQSSGEKG